MITPVKMAFENIYRLEENSVYFYILFNPFPNKPWFLPVCSTTLLKTMWEKEKLLITSNFSFFHSVFYLFGELSAIFIKLKIVVCNLFQFGRVLKFVVWERVKLNLTHKMQNFNLPESRHIWQHLREKEKLPVTSILFSFKGKSCHLT